MFAYHWLDAALDKLADVYVTFGPAERDHNHSRPQGSEPLLSADSQ